jgi:hypothetical protein
MAEDESWDLDEVARFLDMPPEAVRKLTSLTKYANVSRLGDQLYWRKADVLEWREKSPRR